MLSLWKLDWDKQGERRRWMQTFLVMTSIGDHSGAFWAEAAGAHGTPGTISSGSSNGRADKPSIVEVHAWFSKASAQTWTTHWWQKQHKIGGFSDLSQIKFIQLVTCPYIPPLLELEDVTRMLAVPQPEAILQQEWRRHFSCWCIKSCTVSVCGN